MSLEVRALAAALLFALSAGPAAAQAAGGAGFAGLGAAAEGFALPDPAYRLRFPEDHGPHPEFRIEWWYLTAVLRGADGRDYGAQWTLFRTALAPGEAPGWSSPQVWMGHAAVTTEDAHFSAERFARGGIGQAGVTAEPFAAWIDDWSMAGPTLDAVTVTARGDGFAYRLEAVAEGPIVLHGQAGYSVKGPGGHASHYYSQPFFRVSGMLRLPQGEVAVTGTAWLDREWSSQPLEPDQTGWDWFALVFDDGARLMAAQLRGARPFTLGTLIAADGAATPLPDGALRLTPLRLHRVAGRELPVHWRIEVPGAGIDVIARAVNPDAWMETTIPYWEGPVRVSGSHAGMGYLEMTGYSP
jgi:predicted secreted hydrolase